jgi:hypothetical protein
MTPAVKYCASLAPFDAAKYKWFDLTEVNNVAYLDAIEMIKRGKKDFPYGYVAATTFPMPFERVAVVDVFEPIEDALRLYREVGVDIKRSTCVYTLERQDNKLTYCVWQKGNLVPGPTIIITCVDGIWEPSMEINQTAYNTFLSYNTEKEKETPEDIQNVEAIRYVFYMNRFLNVIYGSDEIKLYTPKASPTTLRQIAKGKPRAYNWSTVEIKPYRREPAPPQGGTHASPTPHERRGHVRRLKSGKVVTVRSSLVNKHKIPQQGITYHDYKGVTT